MAMTQEQFVALVQQLEAYAGKNPQQYRLRLVLLAMLGYAYIVAMLLLALGLTAFLCFAIVTGHFGAAIIKLLIFLGILDYVIIRSLWVPFPPPEGRPLTRQQAPALFRLIDSLVAEVGAPPFHRVLLDTNFNAGIVQRPRLGIFGWQQNYLVLGLPLMAALTPEQFRAVLAHELGHLYGQHGRFSGWIYRIRTSWAQLLTMLAQSEHFGSFLFTGFANWYAPYFNAYSFTTARQQEYEADRVAAEIGGAQTIAEALIALQVNGTLLDHEYWPALFKRAQTETQPPDAVFSQMLAMLREPIPTDQAETWLRHALAEETGYADTHPALRDRAQALGYQFAPALTPHLPPRAAETAAGSLLGAPAVERLTRAFDQSWQTEIAPMWTAYHAEMTEGREALAALEAKAATTPLTAEEAWEQAKWTAQLRGEEDAVPLLQAMLAQWPGHDDANFAYGRLLLAKDDGSGIAHVERAMQAHSGYIMPGCELIATFLQRHGCAEEAKAYQHKLYTQQDIEEAVAAERRSLGPKDGLHPHELPPPTLARLRQQLGPLAPAVEAIYLARKAVRHCPDRPLFVLAFKRKKNLLALDNTANEEAFANQMLALLDGMELPGSVLVMSINGNAWLEKKMRAVPGAPCSLPTDTTLAK